VGYSAGQFGGGGAQAGVGSGSLVTGGQADVESRPLVTGNADAGE